jgi:undecaprenyl-diphosphatase
MNFARVIKNFLFLLVAIFSGAAFTLIAIGVSEGTELTPFNVAIEDAIAHVRTPILTNLALLISNIGSPLIFSVLAIFLAILLLLHRDTYDALLYLVSIALAVVSFVVMKNMLHISRPTGSLIADLNGWSFPSGHATVATAFFFATGYSFFDWPKRIISRIVLVVLCAVGAVAVSVSRVYLGAHFALDVLAGTALGLLCVSFTAIVFNIFLAEQTWVRRRYKKGI